MDTAAGATDDLGNRFRKRSDLRLEICAGRRQAFQKGNEHRKVGSLKMRVVFSILVGLERAQSNPSLAGRSAEDAANRIGDRLRKAVPNRVIQVGDKFHRDDGHAA